MAQIFLKKDQIYERLKQDIIAGRYAPGERLPNEDLLAAELQVGRVTLRSAVSRLEAENFLVRQQGKGTFIRDCTSGRRSSSHFLMLCSETGDSHQSSLYIMPSIDYCCSKLNIKVTRFPISVLRSIGHEQAVTMLRAGKYDKVILLTSGYLGNEPELAILRALDLPVLLPHGVQTDGAVTGFATLYYPLHQAVDEMIQFIGSHGIGKIATFNFQPPKFPNSRQIFGQSREDYLALLERNKLSADPGLIFEFGLYDIEAVEQSLLTLKRKYPEVRFIQCCTDFCALNVYNACARLGFRIPRDFAVMGFCGYPGGRFMAPSLSTIDLQYENIGRMTVDLLCRSDEWNGQPPFCRPTPYRLFLGGSTRIKEFR